jgi:hypothetical protein
VYRDSHSDGLGDFSSSMTDSPEMFAYIVINLWCKNHFPMFAKLKRWFASTKAAQLATDVDRPEVVEVVIDLFG